MEAEREFVDNITRLDWSTFSLPTGIRAGAFVVLPFLLEPLIGYVSAAFAALAGMWLTNTDGPKSRIPIWVLLVACFTESAAVGLGTLSGTTGAIAPLLVGVGVFLPMLVHGNPTWTRVGTFTAITFAVGVGLPGGSDAAMQRTLFSLLGTLLVLMGIEMQRHFGNRVGAARGIGALPVPGDARLHPDALRNAVTVGTASAVGFSIGMALGLPRDFWVVITIILTVQPSFNATLTFTSGMLLGTIIGAILGAAVVIGTKDVFVQLLFLSAFAVLMFATRGVNLALVQVFLAPFIIVLLYVIYQGQANFAEARVEDVLVGGLISIVTVSVLGLDAVKRYWKKPA